MCDCIKDVNAQLEPHNAWLVTTLFGVPQRVVVGTCKREEKRRGKAPSMLASFCPFCGERYAGETSGLRATADLTTPLTPLLAEATGGSFKVVDAGGTPIVWTTRGGEERANAALIVAAVRAIRWAHTAEALKAFENVIDECITVVREDEPDADGRMIRVNVIHGVEEAARALVTLLAAKGVEE